MALSLRCNVTTRIRLPSTTYICAQCRQATLLRRPKRPYTFTQLVALSDGSTFIHRTTSPLPVYRSTRDTRNSLLWNPSSSKLMNVEEDEAGRLAAFRSRFGRSWDAATSNKEARTTTTTTTTEEHKSDDDTVAMTKQDAEEEALIQEEEDNLLDLISSYGQDLQQKMAREKGEVDLRKKT